MENSTITPDCILAGLGELDRKELAGMIALLENAKFLALAVEFAEKAGSKLKLPVRSERFAARVSAAADKINDSTDETNSLRHHLWCMLRKGVDLDVSLPLATRTARRESVELGHQVSKKLSSEYSTLPKDARRSKRALDWIKRKTLRFGGQENLEFGKIVELEATRLLGALLKEDALDAETKSQLMNEIRAKFEDLPADLKDEKLQKAISSGDWEIIGAVLTSGSFVSIAIAVEIAGFSAYILAAKASAIVPFIGGKTAVSLLAVLANPLFIIFVLVGCGWFTVSGVGSSVRSAVSTRIVVLLALKGLLNRRDGCAALLNDFRTIDPGTLSTLRYLSPSQCQTMRARGKRVEELACHAISRAPGIPPPPWDKQPEGEAAKAIEDFLHIDQKRNRDQLDVLATGILTAGDLLYASWSINPLVIQAADFSRSAEIDNIFEFSAFAGRWEEMSAASAQGLENSLQGYTAEQLVLTRLVEEGHAVELAASSNTPGFDILVDGMPFQIKCGEPDSISLLTEHFEKYQDVPVIANTELAAGAAEQPWADQVFVIDGFDLETVREMTSTALEAGAAIGDLPIPFYAVIVGIARNLQDLKNGRMGFADLPSELVVEAVIRGTLATVGAKTGAVAGLIFFGPAGPVILSPVGGVISLLATPKVRQLIEDTVSPDWSKEVVERAASLRSNVFNALDRRLRYLNREPLTAYEPNTVENWLYARKLDDIIASAEQRTDIESLSLNTAVDGQVLLGKVLAAQILDPAIRKAQLALIQKLKDKPKTRDALRKGGKRIAETVSRVTSKAKS